MLHAQLEHEARCKGDWRTCLRAKVRRRGRCSGSITSRGPLQGTSACSVTAHRSDRTVQAPRQEVHRVATVADNVRQAVFQARIKDASIRDHLALHAGRLNSFDKMASEASTVARTRNENDNVPMDVSVLKGKGKGKDGKS